MLDKRVKPSFIVKYLDQYVIGQDDAKKILAVAVYSHYRKIARMQQDGVEIAKSNVLLIGPSGSGKTLMCETLSRVLGVPFVTANATSLAQTRYVNDEIEAILQRLLDKAGDNIKRAQQGIIFIDEIDKLKAAPDQPRDLGADLGQVAAGIDHCGLAGLVAPQDRAVLLERRDGDGQVMKHGGDRWLRRRFSQTGIDTCWLEHSPVAVGSDPRQGLTCRATEAATARSAGRRRAGRSPTPGCP